MFTLLRIETTPNNIINSHENAVTIYMSTITYSKNSITFVVVSVKSCDHYTPSVEKT